MRTRQISVHIPRQVERAVREFAKRHGLPKSAVRATALLVGLVFLEKALRGEIRLDTGVLEIKKLLKLKGR